MIYRAKFCFMLQFRAVGGRSLSTHAELNYTKALLKKFIFQVHPDYFNNFKSIQTTNGTNLKILQNLMTGDSISSNGVKSLIFYVKPPFAEAQPKRVKVSLNRLKLSIVEILETVGVEVPPLPESKDHSCGASSGPLLASPEQILEFLESMIDRKELVGWREERIVALRRQEEVK
jgi:hypothetical protein